MKWLSWFTPKPFPPEAVQQLAELGFTSDEGIEHFKETWRSHGERFFWSYLEKKRESQKLQTEYEPRLRAYAAKHRLEKPLPLLSNLSVTDRAKYEILCNWIEASRSQGSMNTSREKNVGIVSGNLITLLAVRATLGTTADSLVLMLEEEQSRWFNKIYRPPGWPLWWYSLHWLKIVEFREAKILDKELIEKNYPKPDGFEYWVLNSGCMWGELAGGSESQLWKWDGSKAEPIEFFSSEIY